MCVDELMDKPYSQKNNPPKNNNVDLQLWAGLCKNSVYDVTNALYCLDQSLLDMQIIRGLGACKWSHTAFMKHSWLAPVLNVKVLVMRKIDRFRCRSVNRSVF